MDHGVSHLAIILDGNRRWAKEHGLLSFEGHRRGYDRVKEVGDWCLDRGIRVLTVFAFSTENWKRTEEEVGYLMDILEMGVRKDLDYYKSRNIRLRILGRRDRLRPSVLAAIEQAETATAAGTAATFCICINYGGRSEIVDACRALVARGVQAEEITEEAIQSELYWPEMPAPDLLIRTSGEERLSNFLTWETVYSELYWTPTHWPAFDEAELDLALQTYAERQRRYGA